MQNGSYPLVVEIKRDSHEDGPGIRSVVFFKGCPLRCVFCHSPETQDPKQEIVFSVRECTNC
jgi:pyruvate formate lyase activating enzyme